MASAPKMVLLSLISLVLVITLGVGGYFLWQRVDQQHDENVERLSGFGSKVVPISQGPSSDQVTIGTGGQVQLPPSIQEEKLSATERIIISLSREKETLLAELKDTRDMVSRLEKEVNELRGAKNTKARFAPLPLQEERNRAIRQLEAFFQNSREAQRFNDFETEAMMLAATNVYMEMLRRHRLSFDETQKDRLISRHLPAYAFCVGNDVALLAETKQQQRHLLEYLRTEDLTLLSRDEETRLRNITDRCRNVLDNRLVSLL